jgi:hypothetical protein
VPFPQHLKELFMSPKLKYHGLEYHGLVRFRIPAPLAALGFLAPLLFLLPVSSAQTSSSHSSGSGHSGSIASASTAHHSAAIATHPTPHAPPTAPHPGNNWNSQPRPAYGYGYYPYLYAVPFPYAESPDGSDAAADDPDEQGGPTVFDRRGSGQDSYVPPTAQPDGPAQDVAADDRQPDNSSPAPDSDQPQTTLVFKDGHQLAVDDYVIANQTLYDMTPGHPRKIALADLDLPATEKQNDDNGVPFRIPPSAQAY